MICPATMQGCCDDICCGGGCMRYRGGEPALMKCDGCGELVPCDGTHHDVFRCECKRSSADERDGFCDRCGEPTDHALCEDCYHEERAFGDRESE